MKESAAHPWTHPVHRAARNGSTVQLPHNDETFVILPQVLANRFPVITVYDHPKSVVANKTVRLCQPKVGLKHARRQGGVFCPGKTMTVKSPVNANVALEQTVLK